MRSNGVLGYAAGALSAALFGLIALLTTGLYAAGASGMEIVFWRLAIAAAAAGAFARVRAPRVRIPRACLPWVALACALYAGGVVFLCLAYGTQTSAGLSNTVYHMYPLIVLALSAVGRRARVGAKNLLAGALAMFGTAVVFLVPLATSGQGWSHAPEGVALALASAACYAGYSLLLDRADLACLPTTTLFTCGCVFGMAVALPFMLASPNHLSATPGAVGALLVLGLACTAAPYLLYIASARLSGPTSAALLSYLEYPVTIAALAVFAGEVPSACELAGCALIAAGGIVTVLPGRAGADLPDRLTRGR